MSVVRNMAGPVEPHAPADHRPRREKASPVGRETGPMPDGAVIIAAITSCTNTRTRATSSRRALLARNANPSAWCANRG